MTTISSSLIPAEELVKVTEEDLAAVLLQELTSKEAPDTKWELLRVK